MNDVAGPFPGNSFRAEFGGACENQNSGNPIVLYDHVAARWVFTQFAPAADKKVLRTTPGSARSSR